MIIELYNKNAVTQRTHLNMTLYSIENTFKVYCSNKNLAGMCLFCWVTVKYDVFKCNEIEDVFTEINMNNKWNVIFFFCKTVPLANKHCYSNESYVSGLEWILF